MRSAAVLLLLSSVAAEEDLAERLRLETHGFASFGWLQTWGNDWLGETRNGTTQFHEAALNAVARPIERLRIGAQGFARDLGRYDNSRVVLDWAYADWRAADGFGVRAGRVKIPTGLWNDLLDVDAGRTPAFLPVSLYAVRARDLFLTVDGGLVYGFAEAGGAGSLEWSLFAGDKRIADASGTAAVFTDFGFGAPVTDVETGLAWGGMLHWHTPLEGLGVRLTCAALRDLEMRGDFAGATARTRFDDYGIGVASLVYDVHRFTFAAEGSRYHGRGALAIDGLPGRTRLRDDSSAGYVSATWRQRPWLEWYLAGEGVFPDPGGEPTWRAVAACAVRPLPRWSIKAEVQQVDGTGGLTATDNPDGLDRRWQVLALKTTVDF